jgi:uncharacterized protein (TIGR03032 family)
MSSAPPEDLWAGHDAAWRDPAQVTAHWGGAPDLDRRLLRARVRGGWWETLAETGITLLVTREYEHLAVAMSCSAEGPCTTFLAVPHPSGVAVDRESGLVRLASTRNPNVIFDLRPVTSAQALDVARPLVPVASRFYPGALYIHDLALVGGVLHASAAGENAIVRLDDEGRHERVWWPRCIEDLGEPQFDRNYIQLNSIAAGDTVADSYFSASSEELGRRRPGHRDYPVDGRGVIFSGETREPVVRGLTRPHSARLSDGRLWVANSGYGELGRVDAGVFEPFARLPGWTRGLCFVGGIAFVGTSRVIPRFRRYAPGLDVDRSECAVHAVDLETGKILGSVVWPAGNQIFAIEWLPAQVSSGFPFRADRPAGANRVKDLFSSFAIFEEDE